MRCLFLLPLALLLLLHPATGQGLDGYTNFEAPRSQPLAVASLDGADYLLVCNTPDSRLEIYDTRDLSLVARVRTGLSPVAVHYVPSQRAAFTANRIGDSVSRIELEETRQGLRVQLDRTLYVGDAPSALLATPEGATLLVALDTRGTLAWIRSDDLLRVAPGTLEEIELLDSFTNPRQALRNPRALVWDGPRLHVLGYRSGQSFLHDTDLWSLDLVAGAPRTLGQLGTNGTNLRKDGSGRLWITANEARNDLPDEERLRTAPTGFVRSLLHVVEGAGTANPTRRTRDLNTDANGRPVPKSRALAHPMDLAVFEPPSAAAKIFVAAMHSDRIGIVDPSGKDPQRWPVRTLDAQRRRNPRSAMAAPCALAVKYARSRVPADPGHRLYALQAFDASLLVIDPVREQVLQVVALAADPEPERIVQGRPFLYGARFSASGFVSCASCHLDARTDGLGWRLSASNPGPPVPLRRDLLDGVTDASVRTQQNYAQNKGLLTTQTLQGLVNFEAPREAQELFTNRPYHWRGDRRDLLEFNQTFVTLHGLPNRAASSEPPRGITRDEMRQLADFLHSVHFEPNPEQPLHRRYSGSFGDPDKTDGSGARLGMKLFHAKEWLDPQTQTPGPVLAGRSCVQCHMLPEGSNNRLTRTGFSTPLPIETPGLRGLAPRASVVERDAFRIGSVRVGEFGLEHQGTLRSIADFTTFAFGHFLQPNERYQLTAITQFLREFDTGVAPIVGLAWTLEAHDLRLAGPSAFPRRLFDLCEAQCEEANAGLAVRLRIRGAERGYVFDPVQGRYRPEGSGPALTRTALWNELQGVEDRLHLQMTPLGMARGWAGSSARPAPSPGPSPSAVQLEPMRSNTAWRDVPRIVANWIPGPRSRADAFHWSGVYSGTQIPVPTPASLAAVRALQHGILQDGPTLGLPALRHESPRRLRVSGRDIRDGARLVLYLPADPKTPPSQSTLAKSWPLILPIHPTAEKNAAGHAIWETAAELEPLWVYALMLGGPSAPSVAKAMAGGWSATPPKGAFRPQSWNRHRVFVLNADGSFGDGGLQALTLH